MSFRNLLISQNKTRLAILALIFANIIWGASFPITKLSLSEVPPFTFVFLRFFLSAIIIFPFVYKDLKVKKSDTGNLIIRSFIGITLSISFLVLGLKLSSSINAPIIISSQPIIIIIGAYFFLKEKMKKKVVIGTVISLLGVFVVVLLPLFQKGLDGSITGNLFFVLASICGAIDVLLLKKLLTKYKTLTITFWSFLIGSIPLLPLCYVELNQTHWINHLGLFAIFGVIFSVVLATAIGHTIYNYGLKNILASEVGIFTYVDPVATAIVAIPLLNEVITAPYLIGSALLFWGIFIAEGRIHYHPFHLLRKSSLDKLSETT